MMPTYLPVVNVFGAYSDMKKGSSRIVSGLSAIRPGCHRYCLLSSLSLRMPLMASRWKIQRAVFWYWALSAYFALIRPSAPIDVVSLPVETSRSVSIPFGLAVKTPSGWHAPGLAVERFELTV